MAQLLVKLKKHKMMLLCTVACAAPFAILLLLGYQLSLSWIGLVLCVGIHLLMFKMMPNHNCHSSQVEATKEEIKVGSDDKSKTLEA
jgi:hypothetical protein